MLGNSNFVQQEVHDDGALLLFMRKGVFQARIYLGERKYIFKSLKTRDYDTALRLAKKMLFEIEYRTLSRFETELKSLRFELRCFGHCLP